MDDQHAQFQSEVAAQRFPLKRFAMTLIHDQDRAEDLAQETIVKALANRDKFVVGTNLEAWLRTILKNSMRSNFRKSRREDEDPDEFAQSQLVGADESETEDRDEHSAVTELVNALPTSMAEALRLVAEGVGYEEAAAKTGVPVGTIRSRVNRARVILRELAPERAGRKTFRGLQSPQAPVEELRRLSKKGLAPVKFLTEFGAEPVLEWLPLGELRVDERYQRRVLERGLTNVYRIAAEFDWKKFTPVIVARIVDGLYAIIDGQHRSYAALLRGIERVPCMVVDATLAEQAEAFAAINTRTTKVNDLQIHVAAVAAGDTEALAVNAVCRAAGVEVCRNPVPESHMRVGQTIAIGTLRQYLRRYGAAALTLALRTLMAAHPLEKGVVRAPLIAALTKILSELDELTPETVLARAKKINFVRELIEARIRSAGSDRTVRTELEEVLVRKFQED